MYEMLIEITLIYKNVIRKICKYIFIINFQNINEIYLFIKVEHNPNDIAQLTLSFEHIN